MSIDPTISLQGAPPAPPANPLGMLGSVMDVQSKLNQNKLFAQTFMAKQKMGEMIATTPPTSEGAPDWDAIQQKMLSDPDVAPFAPQAINEIRQLHLTNTDIASKEQEQNFKGMDGLRKALAGSYTDPSLLPDMVKTAMASNPKSAQQNMAPAAQALVTGLTANLPKDPAQARATYQSRVIGLMTASGMGPEAQSPVTGSTYSQDLGGGVSSGVQLPVGQGGQRVQTSLALKTLAPQITELPTPSGAPSKAIVGGAGGLGGAPAGAGGAAGALGITPIAQGPSAAQAAYLGDRGKDMAMYAKNLDDTVNDSGMLLKVAGEARNALQNFKPGGGGNAALNVAQGMQAMNRIIPGMFNDDTIAKVAGGSIQDAEEMRKLMGQAVLQVTRANLPQGSRLAVQEFKSFENNNPNLDTDPRAIEKVFQFWTKIYNQNHGEQQALAKDQSGASPGDINTWPSRWQDQQKAKGYIDTDDKTYKTADDLRDQVASGARTPDWAIQRATEIWGPDRSKWPRRQ